MLEEYFIETNVNQAEVFADGLVHQATSIVKII